MLKSRWRYVVRELLWTVVAAGGFAVLFGVANGAFREGLLGGSGWLALMVGSGLLLSAWFVIPIGIGLALVFPRLVFGKAWPQALLIGSAVGVVVGVVVAACLRFMMPLSSVLYLGALSVPYCLVITALAALRLRHGVQVRAA